MSVLNSLTRTLLQNASGTGTSVTILTPGMYAFNLTGAPNGSTVYLEFLGDDGVTWSAVLTLFLPFRTPVLIESGTVVRARVSGGTAPSVTATLEFIA